MTNGDRAPAPPYVSLLIGIALVIVGAAAIRWRDWVQVNTNPFRKDREVTEEERDSLMFVFSAFVVPGIFIAVGVLVVIDGLRHL